MHHPEDDPEQEYRKGNPRDNHPEHESQAIAGGRTHRSK